MGRPYGEAGPIRRKEIKEVRRATRTNRSAEASSSSVSLGRKELGIGLGPELRRGAFSISYGKIGKEHFTYDRKTGIDRQGRTCYNESISTERKEAIMQPTVKIVKPNATIVTLNNKKFFFSYETLMAFEIEGFLQVRIENTWGSTTTKHLKAMGCSQFEIITQAELEGAVKTFV